MADDAHASINARLRRGRSLVTSEDDISCTEGSSWYEECNQCHCEGGAASCTEMGCVSDFSDLDGTCEGNSEWKKDCNWCHCTQGKGVCTLIDCSINGLHYLLCILCYFLSFNKKY